MRNRTKHLVPFLLFSLSLLGCDDTSSDADPDADTPDADQDLPEADADADADGDGDGDGGGDGDADSDGDGDGDGDSDSDGDGDGDGDSDVDADADADDDGWPDVDLEPLPPVTQVVLLAGQSNMVGLGRLDELSPELASPETSVIIHAEGMVDGTMAGSWLPLGPGFGVNVTRFGPELGFGLEIEDRLPDSQWALIKHSIGATSLHTDWDPDTGELYAAFIEHVGRALAELRESGPAEVVGMLWMQGESDAYSPEAGRYEARLRAFINSVRTDLDLPTMPVIVGLIATIPEWPRHDVLRAAQVEVADTHYEVEVVETSDLTLDVPDDPVHYDTEGSLGLGRRFAESLEGFFEESYGFPADFSSIQGEDLWAYIERTPADFTFMSWSGSYWYGSTDLCRVTDGEMHPDGNAAELAWFAPASGRAYISGVVEDGDTSCGDGVSVGIVVNEAVSLWGPNDLTTPGSRSFHLIRNFAQNEMLSFQTSALTTPDCDTTSWSVEITYERAD